MDRKKVLLVFVSVLLLSVMFGKLFMRPVKTSPGETITVRYVATKGNLSFIMTVSDYLRVNASVNIPATVFDIEFTPEDMGEVRLSIPNENFSSARVPVGGGYGIELIMWGPGNGILYTDPAYPGDVDWSSINEKYTGPGDGEDDLPGSSWLVLPLRVRVYYGDIRLYDIWMTHDPVLTTARSNNTIIEPGSPLDGCYVEDTGVPYTEVGGTVTYVATFAELDNVDIQLRMRLCLEPRTSGVEVGDRAYYGDFMATWSSDVPNATKPRSLIEINNTQWINNTVKAVSGTDITFNSSRHFENCTEQPTIRCIDVRTGEGNGTGWFISAGLKPGDSVYACLNGPPPPWTVDWKINETIRSPWAGVPRPRATNHLSVNISLPEGFRTYNYYWDKTTGVLCEYQETYVNKTEGYTTKMSISYKIIATNIWRVIRVPDDYPSIQEAINAAKPEDVVLVAPRTYTEHVTVNKSLTLMGENRETTIIDGSGFEDVVNVTASHVEIRSFKVQNGGNDGIIIAAPNCTFVDCSVSSNGDDGIHVAHSNYTIIANSTLSWNNGSGILLEASRYCTVENCKIYSNEYGLRARADAQNNTFIGNAISDNQLVGIKLDRALSHTLRDNNMTGNTYGLRVDGDELPHFIHDIDTSNTLDGNPVYYLVSNSNFVIEPSKFPKIGYLGLVNSMDITVRDLTLTKSGQGVLFAYTTNSTIENVSALNNEVGIHMVYSSYNVICGSTLSNNSEGIYMEYSNNNTISSNIISNSSLNGIHLYRSNDNTIYHNNFNNTKQLNNTESTNTWDSGAGEGNYWSNYNGTDKDGDGIGDEYLPWEGVDYYPLMSPWILWSPETRGWAELDIATFSNSVVSEFNYDSERKQISFKVTSLSGTSGFCNITTPKTELDIHTVLVDDVEVGYIKTLNDTHSFVYFTYTHSTHTIKIIGAPPAPPCPWDVNNDGVVNIIDVLAVKLHLG